MHQTKRKPKSNKYKAFSIIWQESHSTVVWAKNETEAMDKFTDGEYFSDETGKMTAGPDVYEIKEGNNMPKYIVSTKETVFTDYEVKAKNKKEAQKKVEMGEVPITEPTDKANFKIISVVEDK